MPVTARARRSLGLAALLPCLLLGTAVPASGQDPGDAEGWFDDGTIGSGAGSGTPGTPVRPVGGGSGAGPGGGATGGGDGSTTAVIPNPCRYEYWKDGPAMAAYVAAWHPPLIAYPGGWQAHATDTAGAWYQPSCRFRPGDGSPDALERRAQEFYAANPTDWFGTPPLPPPIPVADLVEYAKDSTGIPLSVVSLNPTGETVVGLRTWVWPTAGLPEPVVSRAESGPNWAQVTATPGKLRLSAGEADVGTCDRAPAYTTGAPDSATDCYVEFRSSSARTGTSQVRVTVVWRVVLTTSDGRNEVLEAEFPRSSTVDVAVAEVQSVLR